jgi:hypothetical protein
MADTKKHVVKSGQRVKFGRDEKSVKIYKSGESIDLTDDEAAAMPWAVELHADEKAATAAATAAAEKKTAAAPAKGGGK